ncbi:FAD-dependent oxidoreductase [Halobacterium wangiae]|uniref:FAD-dependent oxidoreductase n=1 Tax=Halobacterium wangiae TaxID=2902623 RepID=UPI001E2E30E8|nr:FAD-dependent oxidoreductase [Halobacterium wangiae]
METAVSVASVAQVGTDTVVVELDTPPEFDAEPGQFVKLSAELAGETENAFYTISSPRVTDTFEITVGADEDATLGQWLAERDVGDEVDLFGPLGETHYEGEGSVALFAGGPGIGPCVGIAERVSEADGDVVLVYQDDEPVHESRLSALEADGATVEVLDADADVAAADVALPEDAQVFVYGFADFLDEVQDVLAAADRDLDEAKAENFG